MSLHRALGQYLQCDGAFPVLTSHRQTPSEEFEAMVMLLGGDQSTSLPPWPWNVFNHPTSLNVPEFDGAIRSFKFK